MGVFAHSHACQLLSVVLDTPLGLRSEAAAVRGTAVDLLGQLATHLRSDTTSLASTSSAVSKLVGGSDQQIVGQCQAGAQGVASPTSPPPSLMVARTTATSVNAPGASGNALVPVQQPCSGGSGGFSPSAMQQGQADVSSEACAVCAALAGEQLGPAGRRGPRPHRTINSSTVRCGTCGCWFHLECMGLQTAVASSEGRGRQCLPCETRKRLLQSMHGGVNQETKENMTVEGEKEEGDREKGDNKGKEGLQAGSGEERVEAVSELVESQLLLDYLVAGAAASLGSASVKRCYR